MKGALRKMGTISGICTGTPSISVIRRPMVNSRASREAGWGMSQ